ncbi:MAG TPA: hypothetical protein VGB69_10420 [Edaphobacter sp.]
MPKQTVASWPSEDSAVSGGTVAIAAGVIAAVVLGLISPLPSPHTLSLTALIFLSAGFLIVAAATSWGIAAVISGVARRDIPRRSNLTARAALLAALWAPAWSLGLRTPTLATVLAGGLCLALLGFSLKRYTSISVAGQNAFTPRALPFQFESKPLAQVLLPFIALAVLADLIVVAAAMEKYRLASVLAGAWGAVIVWQASRRRSEVAPVPQEVMRSREATTLLMAFAITLVVMLPYLKGSRIFTEPDVKLRGPGKSGDRNRGLGANGADGYSGIILLAPAEERRRIPAPVKHDFVHFSGRLAEPMEIPFDGVYWYFKAPDRAPRPTARVVRGNSLKATMRSSDRYPLLMEAHQRLDTSLDLGCCSAIDMVVQNADHHGGAISLELWVKKKAAPPHYMGTAVIPSSQGRIVEGATLPPEERVSFPIPAPMAGVMFDEITVVVHSAPERARLGAQIAIRRFVLQP